MINRLIISALTSCVALSISMPGIAQDLHITKKDFEGHFPNQVYFGDTYLHSNLSTDAGMHNRIDRK